MLGIILVLAAAKISLWIYSGWGLITIHADKQPISLVLPQIERQGHVKIRSDLDPSTPVTMHVDKVPLAIALETLATVVEARWRLTYCLAPDAATLATGVASAPGQAPEGWKTIFFRLPPVPGVEEEPDPRFEPWKVEPQTPGNLQAYLEAAGRATDASFLLPTEWNPLLASVPASGEIRKAIPKLAKAAGGRCQEFFTLRKERLDWGNRNADRREEGPREEGRPRPEGEHGAIMAERMQAAIARLPEAERPAAQAEFDRMRALWQEMRNLPPEERRAKMEEMFRDPKFQERMEARETARDGRRTPEQRFDRYKGYVSRKLGAKGAQ